jgi:hypothetical protein
MPRDAASFHLGISSRSLSKDIGDDERENHQPCWRATLRSSRQGTIPMQLNRNALLHDTALRKLPFANCPSQIAAAEFAAWTAARFNSRANED